jgi:hypothetical protein
MLQSSTIRERLLAHARLYREIADANEETANKPERLAHDCMRAARDADPEPQPRMFHSAARSRPATA